MNIATLVNRSYKTKSILVLTFLVLLSITSCNRNGKSEADKAKNLVLLSNLQKQSEIYSNNNNNDSAIYYADLAINFMHNIDFNNSDTLFSLLCVKARAYQDKGEFDSVIVFLEKHYMEADEQSDTLLQAKTAILLGEIALAENNLCFVEKYIPKAIKLLENNTNNYYKAKAYSAYGSFLTAKNDHKKAIEYLLKAYKIFNLSNLYSELSSVSIDIGNNFNAIGSKKDELYYYMLALDAATRSKDTANLMNSLVNLGVYYRNKNPDSSLFYYDKVIAIKPIGKTPISVLLAKYNKAGLFADKKDFNKAFAEFNDVLAECLHTKNYIGVSHAYSGIASVYEGMKMGNQAIDCLKQAVKLTDSIGEISLKMSLLAQLQSIYEENDKYKEAYFVSKEINIFKDSTMTVEKQIAIHEMESNYQSEKKELENKLLRSELAKKDKLLINRYLIIIALLLITLILGVLLWRDRMLYKQRAFAYDVLMRNYKQESEQYSTQKAKEINFENSIKTTECNDTSLQLYDQIIDYYKTKKPYLEPFFKVDDIVTELNSSNKAIAQALKCKGYNFFSLTNLFRVEEAKTRMANKTYLNYKIEAIAKDSGFGTRMSFYNAFEQVTGIKPKFYRDNINADTDEMHTA